MHIIVNPERQLYMSLGTIKEVAMTYYEECKLNDPEMITLEAECDICGNIGTYEMNEEEFNTWQRYVCYGRMIGKIQDLFPKVPAWIRSGAIDQYSGGFCICPECSGV